LPQRIAEGAVELVLGEGVGFGLDALIE